MLTQHAPLAALDQTIQWLEAALTPPEPLVRGSYPHIALPYGEFLHGMAGLGGPTGRRFLDVGCGIGTKVLLARMLGWEAEGLDHHEPYLAVARRLCPDSAFHLSRAEDFGGYAEFDVVYTYRPLVELEAQAALTRRVIERMRPGALLFVAGGPDPDYLEPVADGVWRV